MMQTNEIEAIKSLLATPKKIGIIPLMGIILLPFVPKIWGSILVKLKMG